MNNDFPFKEVWIFGLGLLGGSIAKAIRKCKFDTKIFGVDRTKKNIQNSVDYKVLDDYFNYDDIDRISGLAIICTPVDVIEEVFNKINAIRNKDLIATDVGSTKKKLIEKIKRIDKSKIFVGSHPLAGSEKCGFENSVDDLFLNKIVVVTPTKSTKKENLNKVLKFWENLGSKTVILGPGVHDKITAATSHTVHLMSCLTALHLKNNEHYDGKYYSIYGNGLVDTTRISMGNEDIWTSICEQNKENILRNLKSIKKQLKQIIKKINNDKYSDLKKLLYKAKIFRENITK